MDQFSAENYKAYWSRETNPLTGEQFEIYRDTLMDLGNPNFDIEKYLSDEYAARQTERLHRRFRFTADPMGEACLSWYRSIGLKKEMFESDDFFTRWVLFSPLTMASDAANGKKFPLIFVFHGGMNSIETEEFSDGFTEIAAKEGFLLVYPQNTNADRVLKILDALKESLPVDTERIYVTGFSQGGYQTRALVNRHPELFAAHAPCGNDPYRPFDFQNVPYTETELQHLKEVFVPFLQIVGCCEPNFHVPRYQWHSRLTMLQDLKSRFPGKYDHVRLGMDFDEHGEDATYPHDPDGKRLPTVHPAPQPGDDIAEWAENRINLRLDLLGCERRDVEKCLSYAETPDTETHHVLGFYGDRDGILTFYGRKHYFADIWNSGGLHAFRYVAVDNAPHWPCVTWAEIAWAFSGSSGGIPEQAEYSLTVIEIRIKKKPPRMKVREAFLIAAGPFIYPF